MIIAPILPLIGRELGIAEALLGTLVSAYALMVGIFAVISGPISDSIGRRRILLLGTILMTGGLLLHGFVGGYVSFLVVRILTGIAGGILSGAAVSYVGDFFPYARRGWAMGWVMSGTAFGQIAGIPLGVLLAGHLGFRTPFLAFSVTMAATVLLVWFNLPQPPVRRSSEPVTLAGGIRSYREMLKIRGVGAGAVSFFLMFLSVSLFVTYLPTWLVARFQATPSQIASLFLIGGIANVLTGPLSGHLSDRIGRKKIILASCLGLSAVMIFTTVLVRDFFSAYLLFFLVMILIAMRVSPFSALLSGLVPDDRRGSLMSFSVALGQVGFAVGGALAGPLYTSKPGGGGYASNTLLAACALSLMAWLMWTRIPEPPLSVPLLTPPGSEGDGVHG